jgi:hypothetical protein
MERKRPLRFQELFVKAASPRREMAGWVLLSAESSWWGDSTPSPGCPRVRASAGKIAKTAKPDSESSHWKRQSSELCDIEG